ncbi:hypothetical protein K438DRAFT_2019537 [Mycena galopus ATCC 62051]|nr:hypothetical protein K438DRAFT_2019537 [Mycena galopus ATCC 62051]
MHAHMAWAVVRMCLARHGYPGRGDGPWSVEGRGKPPARSGSDSLGDISPRGIGAHAAPAPCVSGVARLGVAHTELEEDEDGAGKGKGKRERTSAEASRGGVATRCARERGEGRGGNEGARTCGEDFSRRRARLILAVDVSVEAGGIASQLLLVVLVLVPPRRLSRDEQLLPLLYHTNAHLCLRCRFSRRRFSRRVRPPLRPPRTGEVTLTRAHMPPRPESAPAAVLQEEGGRRGRPPPPPSQVSDVGRKARSPCVRVTTTLRLATRAPIVLRSGWFLPALGPTTKRSGGGGEAEVAKSGSMSEDVEETPSDR